MPQYTVDLNVLPSFPKTIPATEGTCGGFPSQMQPKKPLARARWGHDPPRKPADGSPQMPAEESPQSGRAGMTRGTNPIKIIPPHTADRVDTQYWQVGRLRQGICRCTLGDKR